MISWNTLCQNGVVVYSQYFKCTLECAGIERSKNFISGGNAEQIGNTVTWSPPASVVQTEHENYTEKKSRFANQYKQDFRKKWTF